MSPVRALLDRWKHRTPVVTALLAITIVFLSTGGERLITPDGKLAYRPLAAQMFSEHPLQGIPESTYRRVVPSYVVGAALHLSGVRVTRKNTIKAFTWLNFLLLAATAFLLHSVFRTQGVSSLGQNLGFVLIYLNGATFYLATRPVLTDTSAVFLIVLAYYLFLHNRSWSLTGVMIVGYFTHPVVNLFTIPFVLFPMRPLRQDVGDWRLRWGGLIALSVAATVAVVAFWSDLPGGLLFKLGTAATLSRMPTEDRMILSVITILLFVIPVSLLLSNPAFFTSVRGTLSRRGVLQFGAFAFIAVLLAVTAMPDPFIADRASSITVLLGKLRHSFQGPDNLAKIFQTGGILIPLTAVVFPDLVRLIWRQGHGAVLTALSGFVLLPLVSNRQWTLYFFFLSIFAIRSLDKRLNERQKWLLMALGLLMGPLWWTLSNPRNFPYMEFTFTGTILTVALLVALATPNGTVSEREGTVPHE